MGVPKPENTSKQMDAKALRAAFVADERQGRRASVANPAPCEGTAPVGKLLQVSRAPVSMTPEQFAQHLRADIAKLGAMVKTAGAKID
jgi:hypothetical protein